jgi:transcriptional regulator with XRE-family HTH domain
MTDALREGVEMEHIVSDDIGGRLRRARECRGLSLADAARLTKLSLNVLQAIERNDFTSLPGGMFRKAYVRTLAAEFGLNPNELAADYCARFEPPVETTAVPNHDSAEEKWVRQLTPPPQRSIVTLAAIAAPAIVWFMLQSGPSGATVPLDSAVNEFAAVPLSPGSIALTAVPASDDVVTSSVITPPATLAPLRIEMAATNWCWVAAETDGARVMYRLVEPGERVVLEGQRTIALRLGNAGAVTLSINDGASQSFGGDGEVVELEVTPDNVEGLRERRPAAAVM